MVISKLNLNKIQENLNLKRFLKEMDIFLKKYRKQFPN